MMSNNNDSSEEEKKRLQCISIPQLFSWTGLTNNNKQEIIPSTEAGLAMEGLVLWNVLGYATGDVRDYGNFMLVNKEWKHMLELMEPPAMFRLRMIVAKSSRENPLKETDLHALDSVLTEICSDPNTGLFRKQPDDDTQQLSLQPQFAIVIMRFVYKACTGRSPHVFNKQMYDKLKSQVESLAKDTLQKMCKIIQDFADEQIELKLTLEQLLKQWNQFQQLVALIADLGNYVEKYYAKHQCLATFTGHAHSCFVQMCREDIIPNIADVILSLLDQVQKGADNDDKEWAELCSDILQALEKAPTSLWTSDAAQLAQIKTNYDETKHLLQSFVKGHTKEKKIGAASSSDNKITIVFPDKTELCPPSHFVQQSGFLKRLHLCSGDIIKLEDRGHAGERFGDKELFERAVQFYDLLEQHPMNQFGPPHASYDIVQETGHQCYADFHGLLNQATLFELITFSNLWDLHKLLNFLCFTVSAALHGRTAEEMRQILNIQQE